jgi:MFS transporter, PAT family, beta-lactamase induction signal transducer AmpG
MKTNKSPLQVFQSRKGDLLLLGFSSGMPLFLTSRTLQAWLTVEGVDLASIGLLSLVALPYSIKFLWAPFLDRYIPPFFGRRRGWLVIAQIRINNCDRYLMVCLFLPTCITMEIYQALKSNTLW